MTGCFLIIVSRRHDKTATRPLNVNIELRFVPALGTFCFSSQGSISCVYPEVHTDEHLYLVLSLIDSESPAETIRVRIETVNFIEEDQGSQGPFRTLFAVVR